MREAREDGDEAAHKGTLPGAARDAHGPAISASREPCAAVIADGR
jgi:hypothetical protein